MNNEKIPLETLLGNVAGSIHYITQLDPKGNIYDKKLKCSPIPGMPWTTIEVSLQGADHKGFSVNGISVGNVNGAIAAFNVLCAKYLHSYYAIETPLHNKIEDPKNYYNDLREKLYNSTKESE